MAKIHVRPNRDVVPPHPIDGAMRPDGSMWTADQYTFRLIRDGDIVEVVDDPPPPPPEGGASIDQPDAGVGDPAPKAGDKPADDPPKRKRP